jgi:hypothetical protein
MPTKIETSLSSLELMEFFKRCAQTKGGTTGPAIQALAAEFGVTISHESANTFRKTAMQEYLDDLKASARFAEDVATIAKDGAGMADGAAAALAAKVFDKARRMSADDIGSKEANNVSLAIARLKTGDRGDKKLAADLALREEQLAKLQREKTEWEEERAKIRATAEAAGVAINKPKASPDEIRAQTVALIDEIMGIKTKKA